MEGQVAGNLLLLLCRTASKASSCVQVEERNEHQEAGNNSQNHLLKSNGMDFSHVSEKVLWFSLKKKNKNEVLLKVLAFFQCSSEVFSQYFP